MHNTNNPPPPITPEREAAVKSGRLIPATAPNSKTDNADTYLTAVTKLFAELRSQRFFGELEIKLEHGLITHIWKSQSLKPEAIGLPRSNHGNENNRQ